MSMPIQSRTAQISAGLPYAQYIGTSHSYRHGEPRPLSHALLASLNIDPTPSEHELYTLQVHLDSQCVQLARKLARDTIDHPVQNATSDMNSVVELAVKLSGPLCLARHPGTFLYQEIQLRALISCLSLLHYHGVQALYPEQWDKLKRTDLQRIAFQLQPDSTLSERIRYAPNVYLLQLASQYLSFINRGDSNLPLVVGPIVNIFWGSVAVAGHQYNHIQRILQGLTELFTLWQSSQTRYKALWGLQEYTRLASSLCRDATYLADGHAMREAAAIIVSALLRKVEALIDDETRTSLPSLGGQWPRVRMMIDLSPPELNQGYYLFGLLDCAAQLATLTDIELYQVEFVQKMSHMACTGNVPEYRWKAAEVLLSFQSTRQKQFRSLRSLIAEKCTASHKNAALEEVTKVCDLLEQDERARLRFCTTQSLPNSIISDGTNETSGTSFRTNSTSLRSTSVSLATSELSDKCGFREPDLPLSKVKAPMRFSVDHPIRLSFFSSRDNFTCAGLSTNCRHAFFYNETRIATLCLEDHLARCISPRVLRIEDLGSACTNRDHIFDVVMSPSFLVVVTSRCVLLKNFVDDYSVDGIAHGDWEATGAACCESRTHFTLAVGQGQGNSSNSSGQIEIYQYEIGTSPRKLSYRSTIDLQVQDRPKRIYLTEDARILTCVTTIQNKLLIWHLDDDFSASTEPFIFLKNQYRREKYETGLTSTSIYTSPTNTPYLLCTTAPSSERHSNNGEWSFIIPIPSLQRAPPTPRLQPTSRKSIHSLPQLRDHRALHAGAASSKHNVFAVLEDDGRISLLPLAAGPNGGICGTDGAVKVLECGVGGGGCLRFTPDGERLIAVGAKGKIVVVDFEAD